VVDSNCRSSGLLRGGFLPLRGFARLRCHYGVLPRLRSGSGVAIPLCDVLATRSTQPLAGAPAALLPHCSVSVTTGAHKSPQDIGGSTQRCYVQIPRLIAQPIPSPQNISAIPHPIACSFPEKYPKASLAGSICSVKKESIHAYYAQCREPKVLHNLILKHACWQVSSVKWSTVSRDQRPTELGTAPLPPG
jgi:hypothetical protein